MSAINDVFLKNPQNLMQPSEHKRYIAPDKLKLMHHVFVTMSQSESSKMKILISL